jgi:hypothetical protein
VSADGSKVDTTRVVEALQILDTLLSFPDNEAIQ